METRPRPCPQRPAQVELPILRLALGRLLLNLTQTAINGILR